MKQNRLSIYLLKDNTQELLGEEYRKSPSVQIGEDVIYYKEKQPINPDWIKNFFNNNEELAGRIKVNSAQAVFIKSIENHKYAIAFGTGRFMLEASVIVPYFGLKVVLNLADKNKIRKMETKICPASLGIVLNKYQNPATKPDLLLTKTSIF
ncbi:hypothetical protein FACS1894186_2500 [Alphaproteobacteria bacterium]|nr:hypothetical protein FACS1894186_2500 [Alphaproteobacteria bacterium]